MTIENIAPSDPMVPSFAYNDVLFRTYGQHRNPAYSDAMYSHMDVMADIIATISENAPRRDQTQLLPSASDHLFNAQITTFHQTSLLDRIYSVIAIIVLILILGVALRIGYACGLHLLLYKLCCRPLKQNQTTRTNEFNLVPTTQC